MVVELAAINFYCQRGHSGIRSQRAVTQNAFGCYVLILGQETRNRWILTSARFSPIRQLDLKSTICRIYPKLLFICSTLKIFQISGHSASGHTHRTLGVGDKEWIRKTRRNKINFKIRNQFQKFIKLCFRREKCHFHTTRARAKSVS